MTHLAVFACSLLFGTGARGSSAPIAVEDYTALAHISQSVRPNLPPYRVAANLSNVANLKLFRKVLSSEEKALIARNTFVVSPTNYTQMFHVYENNEYQRPFKFPAFITTDSMLHTYHLFYDYSLRKVESDKLYDILDKLVDAMLAASKRDLDASQVPSIREAAWRNVAYFAVARALLDKGTMPRLGNALAERAALDDLKLVQAHKTRSPSNIVGSKVDFSQFVPRGHYTRSDKLKRYFTAMMWFGNVGFVLPEKGSGQMPTLQALLITRNLLGDPKALKLWQTIYEPTAFYVGKADDVEARQYGALADKAFGKGAALEAYSSPQALASFIAAARKLPGPRIDAYGAGRQFRFMGQRFIPDSRVFQELTHPKVDKRSMPTALDVFAAMGSQRALDHLTTFYRATKFANYSSQMALQRQELAATPQATWMSNLYCGWLWTLRSLAEPVAPGYPSFMRSNAWLDKCLLTGLGSWTELRHDTILYAKQSAVECGGEEEEPPLPKGYVEPALDVWTKLQWLNGFTKDGLKKRGILDEQLADTFTRIGDWLDFCRKISIKELTGKRVTREEYEQMTIYGAELESFFKVFAEGDIISEADKDMAVVADVHTDAWNGRVLEEGIGRAAAIYVVVPIEGKLYLTRGAAFTHYEFEQGMQDRLTDEAWQTRLKAGKQPGVAPWVKAIMSKAKKILPKEFDAIYGGC